MNRLQSVQSRLVRFGGAGIGVSSPVLVRPSSSALPFAFQRTGNFEQEPFRHENAFLGDAFLRRCLRRMIPVDLLEGTIEPDLTRFGARACTELWKWGQQCEESPPYVRQTDAWGRRVDHVVTCEAWQRQKSVSAEEGLIAIAYERKQAEFSRLYQMCKLSLYSPSSGLYSCPLAMTDGAAKSIEALGLDLPEAFERLTSRDPQKFWTSGQWMTEKGGGSDVASGTETVAVQTEGEQYRLYGYKWFSSATDSDMALLLARITDEKGSTTPGSKGLSMFYVETKLPEEKDVTNHIQVVKMKNKLGTRQLPTAELLLAGSRAKLISPPGRGVASISHMLTITRLHNVMSSVAAMRKIALLARDYARRRRAFGQVLDRQPLHLRTLSQLETDARGCTALFLDLAAKLGLDEAGKISDHDAWLLRLMTPVAKMYTAKKAVANVSESLECFGGMGYIEDTGLPAMLRDAQVLPIWEGTSTVMSLDVVRALVKSKGEALAAFKARIDEITRKAQLSNIVEVKRASSEIRNATEATVTFAMENSGVLEVAARDFAFSLAHTYIAALLLEHCLSDSSATLDTATLTRWIASRDLSPVAVNARKSAYDREIHTDRDFVFDGYDEANSYASPYNK